MSLTISRSRNINISQDENKEFQALERFYREKTANMFDRIQKTRKRNERKQQRLQAQRDLDMTLHHSQSCPAMQHLTAYNFDSSSSKSSRSRSYNALSNPVVSYRRRGHYMDDAVFNLDL